MDDDRYTALRDLLVHYSVGNQQPEQRESDHEAKPFLPVKNDGSDTANHNQCCDNYRISEFGIKRVKLKYCRGQFGDELDI